ncbi:OBG GTPase family GTP-binding protein [[Eubacterium] cellulosolvens]
MATIEEQIKDIEDEIKNTQYNKATQHHIGKLKAKLARLRDELDKRSAQRAGAVSKGYAVRKSGNATVAIVGYPSVGKSTLLNKITDADSDVGEYQFTTLSIIPGIMEYRGAKIQILDMPGLIKGASKGKGKGKEVISAARSADLLLLMVDVFNYNIDTLINELYEAGFRLNQQPPDITIKKQDRGGINVNTTVKLTQTTEEIISSILKSYGYVNADIVIREDITDDQLIDFISGNRIYIKGIVVVNKTDLIPKSEYDAMIAGIRGFKIIPISASTEKGLEKLRKSIYNSLQFIRLFMRPQGGKTDYEEPLVIKSNSTIGMVCDILHRDFRKKFRYAMIWGRSAKFPGQIVGLNHLLQDKDVVTIVIRR